MKKERKEKFPTTPEFSKLLENIKSVIRSYQQRRHSGVRLPTWLDVAKTKVSVHKRCIRIIDNDSGEQALIIHGKWIPIFRKLEARKFSPNELSTLQHILTKEDTAEKISKRLGAWAEELT